MINGKQQEIGFIQGRLSPLVDGKIQAFPWDHWQDEFQVAYKHSFKIMEWTMDQDRLYENPIMSEEGRKAIEELTYKYEISIPSLIENSHIAKHSLDTQSPSRSLFRTFP